MQLTKPLREKLAKEDEVFRRLYEKHQSLEEELKMIHDKGFLNPEEEAKLVTIKKMKLSIMDQMLIKAKEIQQKHP